jgi:hypothetical protein
LRSIKIDVTTLNFFVCVLKKRPHTFKHIEYAPLQLPLVRYALIVVYDPHF